MSESDKLAQQANDLASRANKASQTNTIIAGIGLAVAIFAAVLAAWLPHHLQQRSQRPEALPLMAA